MTKQDSFTKFENELEHRFRKQLNEAESTEDVKKFFARTAEQLLRQSLGRRARINNGDIELEPGNSLGFRYSERLAADDAFVEACEESDLIDILARMAGRALKRHTHVMKHPDKTESKVFPPPDRYRT